MYHISKKLQEIKAVSREKNIIFRRCISGIFTLRKNTAEKSPAQAFALPGGKQFSLSEKISFSNSGSERECVRRDE